MHSSEASTDFGAHQRVELLCVNLVAYVVAAFAELGIACDAQEGFYHVHHLGFWET